MTIQYFDKPRAEKRSKASTRNFLGAQLQKYLEPTGITINGNKPYDPKILRNDAYRRIAFGGQLAFFECLVDGSVRCDDQVTFVDRVIRLAPESAFDLQKIPREVGRQLRKVFVNAQSKRLSRRNVENHYDFPIPLFIGTLGLAEMTYTCAYYRRGAKTQDEAQAHKKALIGEKLYYIPGKRLSTWDVGSGYGTLAEFLAKNHNTTVLGSTLSTEQIDFARDRCRGLPQVSFAFEDYRDRTGIFDRIVSVGMFEHVGEQNWEVFLKKMFDSLAPDGFFLLHSIVGSGNSSGIGPALNKYIFPGGQIPPVGKILEITARVGFICHDKHFFGLDYARTLRAWRENFVAWWATLSMQEKVSLFGNAFPQYWGHLSPVERTKYFYRLWITYLQWCEGAFIARLIDLGQFLFTKKGFNPVLQDIR